ncbi:hypothetical protein Tco_0527963 [Tanacetum coccineum]
MVKVHIVQSSPSSIGGCDDVVSGEEYIDRHYRKLHHVYLVEFRMYTCDLNDPCDVKIASLKQRIQELEFPQLQQDSSAEEVKTESNVWDNGSEDINPFGGGNLDIGDEEEEYPFVNKYPSFQEEPIVLVKEESYPVYDIDNEEEESMPVYDTDIEDVIEEEEGFDGKGGFGGEEDNIEDVVVVANDLCSSMDPKLFYVVDFEERTLIQNTELMSFEKF